MKQFAREHLRSIVSLGKEEWDKRGGSQELAYIIGHANATLAIFDDSPRLTTDQAAVNASRDPILLITDPDP